MLSDDIAKLHVHKEIPDGTISAKHPGPINETDGFDKLLIDDAYLKHPTQTSDAFQLKTSCKEDEDFVIIPENAWKYLHEIYNGTQDIIRYSIEIQSDDGGNE